MAEKQRPNVVGKGPSLAREILDIFKEIETDAGNLSPSAAEKIKHELSERTQALEKVLKMAYLKTVKAGEIAWDCKEMALSLKASAAAGDEDNALEILNTLVTELDQFIHKIKTFVVRMT